jgi:P27 family predicted phage terminase small subunit
VRGRKPKPTQLKVISGNPGKRKLNKAEPKPTRGIPDCPEYLPPRAKVAFQQLGERLDAMGVITLADGMALELLAMAYEEWRSANDLILDAAELSKFEGDVVHYKDGMTYDTQSDAGTIIRAHPASRLASDAFKRIRAMLVEFGLTPSSRARVHAPAGNNDEADPWAELVG